MCADALIKQNKAQNSGTERTTDIYLRKLILRLKSIGRLACLRLDDGKVYYSDAEEGNKPESETDDIIDNAAKRILGVYRDAFTELAKGPVM